MNFNGKRKTAAIVDLSRIRKNLDNIKAIAGETKVCAVVKADAYGHGALAVSKYIENAGLADYFGVATVEEGIELRDGGIRLPVLLLGITFRDQFELSVKNELSVTVCTTEDIKELNRLALACKKRVKLHLVIDTGMGRIGADPDSLAPLAEELNSSANIYFEGVFSHFSDSSNIEFSNGQIQRFKSASSFLENATGRTLIKHMANSGAILSLPESHFDMLRPGIILYGYQPFTASEPYNILNPAMMLRTEISFIKHVKKGTSISYGVNSFTGEDCYIATIPLGYADGISRSLSNKMRIRIGDKFYSQIGTITMDQIMINLGLDYYEQGTEVFIFDNDLFTVDDYAEIMNTIPYEVTCNISKRVSRYYIE